MVQLYAGNVLLLILITVVGYNRTQFLMGCDLGTALGQSCFLQVECTGNMTGRLLAEYPRVKVELDPGKECTVSEQLDSQTGSPGNNPSGSWYASWAWHWEALHTGVPPLPSCGPVLCFPRCYHYNCGRRGHLRGMKGHLLMNPE